MLRSATTISFAAATLAIAAARTSSAYVWIGYWPTDEIEMRASSVSFPSGSSYRTALGTVEDRFFNNPSKCWINMSYGDTSVGIDNGQNEVWFSSNDDYLPALTASWRNGSGEIVEADVIFFNGDLIDDDPDDWQEYWTTSMSKSVVAGYDDGADEVRYRTFESSCLHEFGHVAGLQHEDDEYNLMGQSWTHIYCNGSTCRSGVGEDYSDGLVDIYGRATGSFEDVGVTLFRHLGSSDGYSTHAFNKMYSSSGGSLSSDLYGNQRRYSVTRGSSYRVYFTYENNGETSHTVSAAFYISLDSTIDTSDTRIATKSMTLGRNDPYTTYATVTIPSDLISGNTLYLGVIIDYNNTLSEVDGSNNAAYHIIKVN
jgi:hypothetical protein